jgi:TPR repeat protein
MKIQTAILVLSCISAMAQNSLISGGNFLGASRGSGVPSADELARQKAYQAQMEYNFIPKDPWREINGQTNYAKGEGWFQFSGEIVAVKPYGIWIEGGYGKPLNYNYNGRGREFFVKNYPYQGAYGDALFYSQNLTAKESGVFTFTNTTGGTTTIRQLDYGVPCDPPAELVEKAIKAEKDQAEAKAEAIKKQKQESDERAVKWLLPQATNGSASAQRSLGIHYLNGQGVETNKETAIYWLTQAANQGDIEASNILAKLK